MNQQIKIKTNKKLYYSYILAFYVYVVTLNLFVFREPSFIILALSALLAVMGILFLQTIKITLSSEKITYKMPLFKKEAKILNIAQIKKEQYTEVVKDHYGWIYSTQRANYMYFYNKNADELIKIPYQFLDKKAEKKIIEFIKKENEHVYLDPYYEEVSENKEISGDYFTKKRMILTYGSLLLWIVLIPILF